MDFLEYSDITAEIKGCMVSTYPPINDLVHLNTSSRHPAS